jgi:hypothetical protein
MADQNIKVRIDLDVTEFNKNVKQLSDALSKVLGKEIKLVNANLEQTAQAANKAGQAMSNAAKSANRTTDDVKKTGKAWNSLSLVVQDLPYGFRGIQNNLPALVGSFAAATGPIYFAFSALIAITTAYEKEIAQLIYGIDAAAIANQKMNEAVAENIGQAKSQIANDQALLAIVNNTTKSTNERTRALNELKEKYKGNLELQALDITDGTKLVGVYNKISDALLRKARATAYATLIAEEEAKIFKLQNQEGEYVVKSLGFMGTSYQILAAGTNAFAASANVATKAFSNQAKEIGQANKNITLYKNKLNETTEAQIANNDSSTLGTTNAKGGKTADQILAEKLKAISKANDAEIKAFTETLDERGKKEYEAGLKLAENLQTMRNAGYSDATTYYTAYRAEMDKIDSYYNNKEIEEARKTAEKIAKDAEVIDNRQLQNSLDALKIQSDVATKINNSTGKGTASERIAILEQYKSALYDLASVGGYTAEQFDKIDDAIARVNGAIEGSKDRVKDYSITWQETTNTINGILTNLVRDTITKFAENIGKALAGEGTNPFEGFGLMIADAAIGIGKALIAYGVAITAFALAISNPFAAIAAGAALVIAGSYLKSRLEKQSQASKPKAFAKGGIISGPTMGLMGEYPGASHNPEVVAPLDKLKSLIGGSGGGTLEARISGNDLLILMNKAGRTNNNTF